MESTPNNIAIQDQLRRLERSPQFRRSKRLLRFLSYTIGKALEGRAADLTEHLISSAVYDRPLDFDPALDGIVRAEAHRLRAKLNDYYSHQGSLDSIRIEYPPGSYIPIFRFSRAEFLPELGKVADIIRSFDWSQSKLGPLVSWPPDLKNMLNTCLRCPFPMVIFWGADFVTFANDAAYAFVSSTHPGIIGRPAAEGAVDWIRLSTVLESVVSTGQPVLLTDEMWLLDRLSLREELYFSSAFSPIADSSGVISGVLVVFSETTHAVIGNRRFKTLSQLGERHNLLLDAVDVCRFAASVFEKNPLDIPFASIYLYESAGGRAMLHATAGVEFGTSVSIPYSGSDGDTLSQIADGARSGKRQLLKVDDHLGPLPKGPCEIPPREIAVLPLCAPSSASPLGFVIVGINPHRPFDQDYREFLEILTQRLGGMIHLTKEAQRKEARIRETAMLGLLTAEILDDASDALRTRLTILLGHLDDVLGSPSLEEEHRHKLTRARRSVLQVSKKAGLVLAAAAGRNPSSAESLLPVQAQEGLLWTEERTVGDDAPSWKRRDLVNDIKRRIVLVAADPDFSSFLRNRLAEIYHVDVTGHRRASHGSPLFRRREQPE
jgi:hypothetical protein